MPTFDITITFRVERADDSEAYDVLRRISELAEDDVTFGDEKPCMVLSPKIHEVPVAVL